MKTVIVVVFVFCLGEVRGYGALVLKAVYSGTASILSGSTTVVGAIGATPNQTKSILVFGVTSSSASTSTANAYVRGEFYDATNLVFSRNSSTTSQLNIRWYIAEFTSGLSVTRSAYTSLCTIPNSSSSAGCLAGVSTAQSQLAFIPAGSTTSATGIGPNSEIAAYVYDYGGTRTPTIIRSGTSGSADVHLQFVDFGTNATVYHGTLTFTDAVDTTKTWAVTGTPADNKVWPFVTCSNSSASANVVDAGYSVSYSSGTLTVQRDGTVGTAVCYYQVIVFADGTIVNQGSSLHSYSSGQSSKTTCSSGCDYTQSLSFTAGKSIRWLGCAWGQHCRTNDNTGQIYGNSLKVDIVTTANKMTSSRENTQGSGDTVNVYPYAIDFSAQNRRVFISSKKVPPNLPPKNVPSNFQAFAR